MKEYHMTKVISFCLWGDDPKYTVGAVRNAERAKMFYSGWDVWIYFADCVPEDILQQLSDLDCHMIPMGEGNWKAMFWRFLPAANPNITVISRDTDSRLGMREKYAVDEWLASDKDFHIMRDHPYHTTEILGGMWGARNGIVKDIDQWISEYEKGDFYQVDQNFLREIVYPKIKDNCIVHDPFFDKKPFPGPNGADWTVSNFVGCPFDEYDKAIPC